MSTKETSTTQNNLLELVTKKRSEDPLWKIFSFVRYWVCPYCGDYGADKRNEKIPLDRQIVGHLLQKCPKYKENPNATISKVELSQKALQLEIKTKVLKFPFWRQIDVDKLWYCPYCSMATDISFPKNNKPDWDLVINIVKHLGYCHSYMSGRGMPCTFDELKETIEQANRSKALRQSILNSIQEDKRWGLKDHKDRWLCPYCKSFLYNIKIPNNLALIQVAPPLIADHLTANCQEYQNGKGKIGELEDLELAVEMRLAEETQEIKLEDVAGKVAEIEGKDSPKRETTKGKDKSAFQKISEKLQKAKEMEESMKEARKRQLSMLPETPQIDGYEFAAIYSPCVDVSGDFYDFIKVDPSYLGIAQGDVTGHGIEGGIVASMARKVLSVVAKGRHSPKEVMALVNDEIKDDLDEKTFVSILYGILDIENKKMKFVRAGHNPLILYNPKRKPDLQLLSPKGMVVGMLAGERFSNGLEEIEFPVIPGDLMVIYTDGLTEAMNTEKVEFGEERFCHYFRLNAHLDMTPLFNSLMGVIKNWIGVGQEQQDDITLVGFRIKQP